jgi:aspartate aminotransferase, mitochondrial
LKPQYYPYCDQAKNQVDFSNLTDFVHKKENEVFLFHACAHNPTGSDLSEEQWKELSELVKKKRHIAIFDCAYQGFASGNSETDAFSLRLFVKEQHQILLCQSFAKVRL